MRTINFSEVSSNVLNILYEHYEESSMNLSSIQEMLDKVGVETFNHTTLAVVGHLVEDRMIVETVLESQGSARYSLTDKAIQYIESRPARFLTHIGK